MTSRPLLSHATLWILSASLLAAQTSMAAATPPSCDDICSLAMQDAEKPSQESVDRFCAVPEDSGLTDEQETAAVADCKSNLTDFWPTTYEQCVAKSMLEDVGPRQKGFAWVYSTLATGCALACFNLTPARAALEVGCFWSGVGATAAEAVAIFGFGSEYEDKVQASLGSLAGLGGSAVNMALGGVKQATTAASSKAAAKFASCASMVVYGVTAGFKFSAAKNNKESALTSCTTVESMYSESFNFYAYATTAPETSSATGVAAGSGGMMTGAKTSSGSGSKRSTQPSSVSSIVNDPKAFADAVKGAMATDSSLRRLAQTEDLSKYPSMLRDAGINVEQAVGALQSGGLNRLLDQLSASTGKSISSEARKNVDELAKLVEADRQRFAASVTPTLAGGSSSSKGAAGAKSPFGFKLGGGKSAAPQGGLLRFEDKAVKPAESESVDEFHTGDSRSLFQIVSHRVLRTRDRLERLEWDAPLNRALHGLARKPADSPPYPAGPETPATSESLRR